MENKFAERLKQAINQNKITQVELAKRVKVSQSVISCYCSGKKEPTLNVLLSICEALDETPNYMLGFDDK